MSSEHIVCTENASQLIEHSVLAMPCHLHPTGTVSALLLDDIVMAATVSTVATIWRTRAHASQLWKLFWSATPMLSDPRSKLGPL